MKISLPSSQHGMSLIEVLVTAVIISVGLLGVAALQLTNLKSNQESHARSQASVLAADILDRIRANRPGLIAGQYDGVAFNNTGNPATIGGIDLAAWQAEIDRRLPGGPAIAAGQLQVQRVAALGQPIVVTVTVRWTERADAVTNRAASAPTFSTRTEI